jgi:hypothetical protein
MHSLINKIVVVVTKTLFHFLKKKIVVLTRGK